MALTIARVQSVASKTIMGIQYAHVVESIVNQPQLGKAGGGLTTKDVGEYELMMTI